MSLFCPCFSIKLRNFFPVNNWSWKKPIFFHSSRASAFQCQLLHLSPLHCILHNCHVCTVYVRAAIRKGHGKVDICAKSIYPTFNTAAIDLDILHNVFFFHLTQSFSRLLLQFGFSGPTLKIDHDRNFAIKSIERSQITFLESKQGR